MKKNFYVNFKIEENKYNIKPNDLHRMKVDYDKLNEIIDKYGEENPFNLWYNNTIDSWCVCGSTAKNSFDEEYCTTSEYWIGIFRQSEKDNIRYNLVCYGGMCGYDISEFYKDEEIDNILDLEIQSKFLAKINQFIDSGIFILPQGVYNGK